MDEESLFAAALEIAGPADRRAFLDGACAGDPALRGRLERLLAADGRPRGILDAGPAAALLTATEPLRPDQPFARRFHLRRKLGAGGMGEVWVADQLEPVRRTVAVKVIRPGLDSDRLLARFAAERQALARMDHPNIAKVLDAGVADADPHSPFGSDRPYFVMELVEGVPINRYCDDRQLPTRRRLDLFLPVCRAVQHAHQKGVIHRDLKPSNILVAEYDGRPVPKVIDFGVAKATDADLGGGHEASTESGALVGTLEYMSPEQAEPRGPDVDTRSDVYALGIVLYELLTGQVPFPRGRAAAPLAERLREIREVDPPRPSARGAGERAARFYELDWIVMKCLEKDRARRYESAGALAADVERYLDDHPVQAGPPAAAYRVRKFLRRHRGPAVAGGLVLLALVGGVIGTAVGLVRAERARAAEAERAAGERAARETAEKRLAQIERGIDVLGAVFDDLDPLAEERDGRPLRAILGDRLDRAAAELDAEAVGDPLAVARLQDRLGQTYLGLGHASKAVPLFERAAATRRALLGSNDPAALDSLRHLGVAYRQDGRVTDAVSLLEQVRQAEEQVRGADDPLTLTTRSELAEAYRLAGQPGRAIAELEAVRDARDRRLGPDAPETLAAQDALARAYATAGRKGNAIALLERVLEARRARFGLTDVRTIHTLNNLARAYLMSYRMRDAVALLEQARDAVGAKLAPDHPLMLLVLDNLAWAYRAFGQSAKAVALGEQVREARTLRLGAYHPDTISTLDNLGMAYRDSGQPAKALPLFEQAAAGVERLGFVHGGAARIVRNLVKAYEHDGQYARAEPWRRKWLDAVKGREGPESVATADELAGLGFNLLKQGRPIEAEPPLRAAFAVFAKARPGAPATFELQSLLGAALLDQHKYAEAEPMLEGAYRGLADPAKAAPRGPHAVPTGDAAAQALDRLVRLYDAWNKPAEAAKWRADRAAGRSPD